MSQLPIFTTIPYFNKKLTSCVTQKNSLAVFVDKPQVHAKILLKYFYVVHIIQHPDLVHYVGQGISGSEMEV